MIGKNKFTTYENRSGDGYKMTRRYAFIIPLSILLACLFFANGIGAETASDTLSSEENVKINFSTWHPHASMEVQTVWVPMLETLKEKSGERITYVIFDGESLGSGPEHYDIVADGRSDMGYATLTWTPGRFPLSDVSSASRPRSSASRPRRISETPSTTVPLARSSRA